MYPTFSDSREARVRRFGFSAETEAKILAAKRCFIVGMGPSLSKINPEVLKDEVVIGVNFVLRTQIRPDLICISDPTRVDPAIDATSPKIITVQHVYRDQNEILSKAEVYHDIRFVPLNKATVLAIDKYPDDMKEIYCGGTVIGDLCLPLAAYLGLQEAYILGMDGFAAAYPRSHVWGTERPSHITEGWIQGTARLNDKAKKLAASAGCTVLNATTGGTVEVFKRVSAEKTLPGLARIPAPALPVGMHFVFRNDLLTAVASERGSDLISLREPKTGRVLRHRGGLVFLAKPEQSENFIKDSSFHVETGFVNRDWFSFRSCNIDNAYITTLDERSGYNLRSTERVFSPYFSSFRAYDTPEAAAPRLDSNRRLAELEEIRLSIGNEMVEQDGR